MSGGLAGRHRLARMLAPSALATDAVVVAVEAPTAVTRSDPADAPPAAALRI
jgi:hypothetical protein